MVEHERIACAHPVGVVLSQNVGRVSADAFYARIKRIRWNHFDRRCDHLKTHLVSLWRIQIQRGHHHHHVRSFVDVLWVEAQAGPASDIKPDVALIDIGLLANIENDLAKLVFLDLHIEAKISDARVKAGEVLIEFEYLPMINSNPLEKTIAVQMGVVRNARYRAFEGCNFAVKPYESGHAPRIPLNSCGSASGEEPNDEHNHGHD